MHEAIAWAGYIGAWLLVLGPLYQASIELREEALETQAAFKAAAAAAPEVPPVSDWWLILPPVHFFLVRRRAAIRREAALASLTPEHQRQLVGFVLKARGWSIVAAGAFFFAAKETWEVREAYEWSVAAFWLLLALGALAALVHTAAVSRAAQRLLARA